jgi:FAD/FMN-containing dehydrogenase
MTPAARISSARLGDIIGSENLLTDPQQLAVYDVDGLRPAAAARPGTAEEIAELVRFAAAERLAIDLTRLNRVLAYDPGDLTLGVEAGIRLSNLQDVLAGRDQFLPLAVPFANDATVGGTISTAMDTPLRQAYGTLRDYVLGMEFVTGEGVAAKGGGRVVKNVAGYDVHKLMIGALGTLGIITRTNFRTFPLPRLTRTFVASFERAEDAFAMRGRIAQSPLAPQALEILSPEAAQILNPGPWLSHSAWSLAVAAAGHEAVLARYAADLSRMAEESKATSFVALADEEKA